MAQISRRRGLVAAALAGVLSVGLVACGGDDGGGSSSSSSDGGSSDPIVIGTSLPLTGEFSQPGQAAEQGYKVWQEMVNADGGLLGRQVDLVIKDDASNQNTIVSDYNALISQDKVDMLLGTFSSLLNLPASAVAEKNKMLYVEPAGGSPDMFNRGYQYLFFAQQATADKQGKVFAEWVASLPENEKPKTAAYPTLDDPFAAPNVAGIQAILEGAGIKTVYSETYAIDTKNFDTIVSAMKNADPDLVVHGAQFEDGIGMTRAMLKADFVPSMFFQTNAPSFGDQFTKAIGVENTEGIFYAVSHSVDAQTPGNAEFVAKYQEMYGGTEVPEDAADAYAAAEVMQAAVEAVGSIDDQAALADWLHSNSVDTILGPLSWDDTGAPTGEFLIGQWQNGKPEIVLPPDAATADVELNWKPGGAG
jgi:branched-chain amino acid transport system substrate-binding protein